MKIGIIGLGTLGRPMARRLANAGHEILAWNRTPGRTEDLAAQGVVTVASPGEACQSELLLTLLSDDDAVESVLMPKGRLISTGMPGLVHICLSTISDQLATRLASAHEALGQAYLSAPVFGTADTAASGRVLLVVGGPRSTCERLRPVLDVLGRVHFLGESAAAANVVKSASHFLMATVVESLRDSMAVVHQAGVDPREFAGIVTQTLFPTPVYQVLGSRLAARELQGGDRVPNPFLRGAAHCAATSERLAAETPLADYLGKA